MRTKHIALLATVMLCITHAPAQDGLQREVDVTRAYEPSVQNSLKISILPDMTDTVQTRPDYHYEITPRPIDYRFAVLPLTAARFAAADGAARLPFYAKLGTGGPLRSAADIRYSQSTERMDYGALFTHTGRYDKITNDMQIKEPATGTDNALDAFLDYRLNKELSIGAEAGYRFRHVTRYGYYYPAEEKPAWIESGNDFMKQSFQNPHARISVGSDFLSDRRVHFRIGAGMDHFADRYQYNQMRWDLDALLGLRIGGGMLTLGADARLSGGEKNMQGYKNTIARFEGAYIFESQGINFTLGAGAGISSTTFRPGEQAVERLVALPRITVEKKLYGGRLAPYIALLGEIIDNSYGELARRNPYLYSGQYAPNTVRYNARVGIRGAFADALKYTLYGGYAVQQDAALWANAYTGYPSAANGATQAFYGHGGNVFTVVTDDLKGFEAGAEFQANILSALTWHAGASLRDWSPDTQAEAWGMPQIEATTSLVWNHRDRLCLRAGVEYTGKRHMYSQLDGGTARLLPGQANLTFGADYFVHRQLGLFVQLDNLLNHDLYRFNHYREPGFGVLAGVKLSF